MRNSRSRSSGSSGERGRTPSIAFRQSRGQGALPIVFGGLLAAAAILTPYPSAAADLWVDRNSLGGACDDERARSQVSKTSPWCTLEAAGATVAPGDVVHVREGVYTERNLCPGCSGDAVLETSAAGTAEAPIIFMAEPGETVVLSGDGGTVRGIQFSDWGGGTLPSFIEVSGFIVRNFVETCVNVVDTTDITIRNVEVTSCPSTAVSVRRSANITIEGCRIHHNAMTGWTSAISLRLCHDGNILRGNRIWSNTDEHPLETEGHGIIMDTCGETGGALIENNVIWDNEGWCIAIFHSNGADIRNNTCWENALNRNNGSGELSLKGAGLQVHNNIFVSRGSGPAMVIFDTGNLDSITASHNILWSPSSDDVVIWPPWNVGTVAEYQETNPYGWGAESLQLDPKVADPTRGVFQLTGTSPAVDSGIDSEAAATDINGFQRPLDSNGDGLARTDRGAFEYGGIFRDGLEFGTWTWSSTSP